MGLDGGCSFFWLSQALAVALVKDLLPLPPPQEVPKLQRRMNTPHQARKSSDSLEVAPGVWQREELLSPGPLCAADCRVSQGRRPYPAVCLWPWLGLISLGVELQNSVGQ